MVPKDLPRYVEDDRVRSMRIRAWFRAVSAIAGNKTAAELEHEFGSNDEKVLSRSCLWDKYRRGETEPRSGHKHGQIKLVERVEARYPGTAYWLSAPLWRLIDKAPMEMVQVKAVYMGLPDDLRSLFISGRPATSGLFWRAPIDFKSVYKKLLDYGNLTGFVAVLAMVKEAEAAQNQDQHMAGYLTIGHYLDHLVRTPIVGGLKPDIRVYLSARWQEVEYFAVRDQDLLSKYLDRESKW